MEGLHDRQTQFDPHMLRNIPGILFESLDLPRGRCCRCCKARRRRTSPRWSWGRSATCRSPRTWSAARRKRCSVLQLSRVKVSLCGSMRIRPLAEGGTTSSTSVVGSSGGCSARTACLGVLGCATVGVTNAIAAAEEPLTLLLLLTYLPLYRSEILPSLSRPSGASVSGDVYRGNMHGR